MKLHNRLHNRTGHLSFGQNQSIDGRSIPNSCPRSKSIRSKSIGCMEEYCDRDFASVATANVANVANAANAANVANVPLNLYLRLESAILMGMGVNHVYVYKYTSCVSCMCCAVIQTLKGTAYM